jgi:hypothetical protein
MQIRLVRIIDQLLKVFPVPILPLLSSVVMLITVPVRESISVA